jgi:hypothetical protein
MWRERERRREKKGWWWGGGGGGCALVGGVGVGVGGEARLFAAWGRFSRELPFSSPAHHIIHPCRLID